MPTPFDLSDEAWEASILKPGIYDANVVSARVNSKNEITWLLIVFQVDDVHGEVRVVEDLTTLDAPPSSARHASTAQGRGRVKAILAGNDKPLTVTSVEQVPPALLGCRASIVVGSRMKDGLRVPSIESVQGPSAGTQAVT